MHKIFVVFLICTSKFAFSIRIQNFKLQCLTDESHKDLADARKELSTVDSYLEKTVETLADEFQKTLSNTKNQLSDEFQKTINIMKKQSDEFQKSFNNMKNQLVTMKTNVSEIVKKVDTDLIVISKDLEEQKWLKYNGHCYYYANEQCDWFTAEHRCREIGGYIVKVDNSSENTWITDNKPEHTFYWIGLTDLQEGDWRWTFDQSRATYKPWYSGYGAKGTSKNCVSYTSSGSYWFDHSCSTNYYFICERDFCF